MAIIKVNGTNMQTAAVYEDPRPSGNRFYFWQDAHKETNLEYVLTGTLIHSTAGTTIQGYGFPSFAPDTANWRHTGILMLGGEVVHCSHQITTNNDRRNNLDFTMLLSMDPANPCRNHRHVTDAVGNNAIFTQFNHMQIPNAVSSIVYQTRYNVVGEMDFQPPTKHSSLNYYQSWAVYWRPSTGNMIQIFNNYNSSNDTNWPWHLCPGRIQNILTGPGVSTLTYAAPTSYQNVMFQFLGASTNGQAIFLNNSLDNDHTQLLMRYNDVDNTITTLATFSSAVTAAGTNAGGSRGTAHGNTLTKFSSKTFADPTSAGNTAWYTPFVDSNGNFHPHFFQWNRTADTFTRNSNITVNWGAGTNQSTNWLPDTISAASSSTSHLIQRFWYNETFTVSGTRYLTLIQCHGSGAVYDTEPKYRTFVTFSVDAADPKILNYHSRVIIPVTPKNIIWLNDERTLMGVFTWNNFYIYSFNAVGGWSQTANLPYRFDAVGRDLLGRIWAVDGGPYTYGRLHLITSAVPTTVSLILAQSAYNYQGSVINTTATLNAYDQAGNRIAAVVTLKVEGSSMRLVSGGIEYTELAVTTSNSADTTVNIRVVSAGTSNILASVNI
jgi:hypothetical protein